MKYENEGLYIAGPECFYQNGYDLWWASRRLAEYYGIPVVLPTSTKLDLTHADLKDNAREIFDDLINQVKRTTAIIADLEFFRGSEPDGGTVFEMGWIFSKGGRLYAYTRDMRTMKEKNQAATLKDGVILDQSGNKLSYPDLPFAPSIVASTLLIEGDFKDALKLYLLDLREERKGNRRTTVTFDKKSRVKNRVYIASSNRYSDSFENEKERIREEYRKKGYDAVFPFDGLNMDEIEKEDPYKAAVLEFKCNMALLHSSSYIVADLNDYHGLEPNSDVSFEAGYAYGEGLKCLAFMSDVRPMRERIPHYGESRGFRDWAGNDVENFNLPVNLMFSTYFEIIEGNELSVLDKI